MAIPQRNKRKARSSPERLTQPPELPHNSDVPSSSSSSAADNFFSWSTKQFAFPPGYRFVPKDQELIFHYLKPFSQGNKCSLLNVPIHRVNIYESNPQHLSEKYEKGNDKDWFYISERTKTGKAGRSNKRVDNGGYWSATVAAQKINAGNGIVGYKTSLEYYVGKQSNSVKGDWLMQEYWFESSDDNNNEKVDHALCKIYLTPAAAKKKKAEEAENEKLKKEEDVEQLDLNQPDQLQLQQPHDIVYQPQYCLLPEHHQPQPFPDNFSELISFQQQPVMIPDDFEDFLAEFTKPHSLDGDEEFNNYGLFEGFFDTEGMIKH
ncbi:putative transcription factor NAM family [Arabidopsis thaliana]|uniref:NAC domain containing protein 64 n=3 Tax=Arabidopsis TaxID=3701 RepID=Q9LXY7_ARATH|nr:NAC domain containing protein 64 [Arabidopsis thaliana]KAG7628743.1 NAC domain [Arabidopsis thaliana x Arabidopsis arenosa]AEE79532.1 NAC domain containing protein 64 [Arabidopsis thaliana]OAP02155.1 NAC064 [Arabidopsis thaliana]CAA0386804.1 unnamed protein product [Arabidopsis thaliana]CAB88056.1 NAM-like protein [Arabidopsis thaliana]|eukprot:NP_191212.1 NAC domain containing protein 64 [Arabidopsis thaliana]